jgi:hypothetical protein
MLKTAYQMGAERAVEEFKAAGLGSGLVDPLLAGGLTGGFLSATGGTPGSLLGAPLSVTGGAAQGASAAAGAKMMASLGQSPQAKALLALLGGVGGWQGAGSLLRGAE